MAEDKFDIYKLEYRGGPDDGKPLTGGFEDGMEVAYIVGIGRYIFEQRNGRWGAWWYETQVPGSKWQAEADAIGSVETYEKYVAAARKLRSIHPDLPYNEFNFRMVLGSPPFGYDFPPEKETRP